MANASTCETCGSRLIGGNIVCLCDLPDERGADRCPLCRLVRGTRQDGGCYQEGGTACVLRLARRAEAAEAELATARELVAVIEERADHLAGELADRERRLDLVRTFNKKLMKTQPRGGLLRPPWEKKGGGA